MRVGILVSRSGPAGLWGPSCESCAMLAAAEINTGDGVLGRAMDLVIADAGETDAAAANAVDDMLGVEDVDAIVGMHPSNVRQAITARIAGRIPYIYTPSYEGGECSPGVAAIGGTDAEMLGPTLPWFVDNRAARRFFIVGNDSVWPLGARRTARHLLGRAGARVVGEAFVPFHTDDHTAVLAAIRAARPDVVLMLLTGAEAVRFNRAFAAAGLSERILRFALGIDETVLLGAGEEASGNLFAALGYIAGMPSRETDRFRELYHDGFGGEAPAATTFGYSCYEGVHLVAALARGGGSAAGPSMANRLTLAARRRPMRAIIPPTLQAARPHVHLAEADGLGFRVLATH